MTPDFPHLAAIRLGYGLSPLTPAPADPQAVLRSVPEAAAPDGWTTPMATDAQRQFAASRRQRNAGEIDTEEFRRIQSDLNHQRLSVLQRRVARAVDAPAGFGERLVQFWTGHFATVARNAPGHIMSGAMVDEAIRPHLNGHFADLLFAADTHPMMLNYLNQSGSVGPRSVFARRRPERALGLNENLAREALELHSLGVSAAYSQADVRELAELLTGLTYDQRKGRHYRPDAAEPGAETVLSESYGGPGTSGMDEIRRVFGNLARHPATAAHLSRKLAIHFAADDPPPDLVAALEAVWLETGGDLAQVNGALVSHPVLAANLRAKARQPFDFLVTALRALGLDGAAILALDPKRANQALWHPLTAMGQPFAQPRGPDGWPELAAAWITPQMLAARIGWALSQPARLCDALPDPRELVETALGPAASGALRWAVPKAENAREGVAIILASADLNRR
ncbi:DUF1800 domain-containing protein [Paracoccus sp. Z118]|uniref:DUF1800 domain-containing protein n=1 Tax=Paracoccus sp. Z118 TaxID=2851017 RepID=UPI001C2BD2B0|nr:DUF1800 domain-containing protein [Paracoccus sp. Z118]MBV0891687.1 DUF1800 domain-containing protein [Paracoccus sp. Z118]